MGIKDVWHAVRSHLVWTYDDEKFWSARHALCMPGSVGPIRKAVYQLYVQREMRRSNADIPLGWNDDAGCTCENFASPPNITAHGLNGIVIAGGAVIGKNVTISHQVTIGRSRGKAPVIGDNVYIGPGAKVFGGIRVGDNVKIGANCVVCQDVPNNATIVPGRPRVIEREKPTAYHTFKADEYKPRAWAKD